MIGKGVVAATVEAAVTVTLIATMILVAWVARPGPSPTVTSTPAGTITDTVYACGSNGCAYIVGGR